MTFIGKIVTLFPLTQLIFAVASFLCFIRESSFLSFGLFIFFIYFYPPLLWRLHQYFWPLVEGESDILAKRYSPWWTSHQMQMLYMALPMIESLLRLVPGAYSAWLRLWGSQIGRNVYWTPGVYVYDRNLLIIGDHVIIGERASFVSHYITPKGNGAVLVVKKITVEDQVFIGAASVLSPGCHLKLKAILRAGTELYPDSLVDHEGLKAGKIKGMPKK